MIPRYISKIMLKISDKGIIKSERRKKHTHTSILKNEDKNNFRCLAESNTSRKSLNSRQKPSTTST